MSQKNNKSDKPEKLEVVKETKLQKFSRVMVQFFIYAILVVPVLIFSPWHLQSFEMPKAVIFLFLATWLAIFYLIYKIVGKDWSISKSQKFLLKIFGLLFVFKALSFLFSPDKSVSFWGSYTRFEGLALHLLLAVWFFVLLDFVKSKKQILRYIFVISITAGIVSLYGVLQKFGHDFSFLEWEDDAYIRIASTLGNPLFLSIYCVFTSILSLYAIIKSKAWWKRILLGLSFILQIMAIAFTFTSSSLLAMAAAIAFFAIFWTWKKNKKISYAIIAVTILSVVGLGLVVADVISVSPLKDFSYRSASNLQRIYTWQTSVDAFSQKPILGWGNELYRTAYDYNKNTNLVAPFEMNFDRAHNFVLDNLVMQGVFVTLIWLVILIWLIVKAVKKFFKTNDNLYLVLAALIFAFIINGLVSIPTISIYVLLYFVSAMIFFADEKTIEKQFTFKLGKLVIVVACVAGILLSWLYFKPWRADLYVSKAMRSADWLSRTAFLQDAIDMWPQENYLAELYKAETAVIDIATGQSQEYVDLFIKNMDVTLEELKKDFGYSYLTYVMAGKYYGFMKDEEQMNQNFEQARSLAPSRFDVYWYWADAYILYGDKEAALEKLMQAVELDSSQPYPYFQVMQYYKREGDEESAEKYKEIYRDYYDEKYLDVLGL